MFDKKSSVGAIKSEIMPNQKLLETRNYTKQLSESLQKEEHNHLFGCWYFRWIFWVFIVNMHELLIHLQRTKKVLELLMLFKKFQMSLIANQTKYGKIKVANFTIDQWNHGCRIMI